MIRPNPSIPHVGLRRYLLGIGPKYPIPRYKSTSELISTILLVRIRCIKKITTYRVYVRFKGHIQTKKCGATATSHFLVHLPQHLRTV